MKSNKSKTSCKQGFTLIELLVVVLIIGILAAVAVPQYQKAVDKTRVSQLFAIVKNIKMQQELFYLANGHYAADCDELEADLPAGAESSGNSGGYRLPGDPYFVYLKCKHDSEYQVMGILTGPNFNVHIETYFDHIPDTPQYQGRTYCQRGIQNDRRSMNVCQSLGTEKRDDNSYWL